MNYGLSQNDDEDPYADRALSQVRKRLLGVSTGEVPEIAFSQIDKVLYQLDKEKGNKVIY